MYVTRELRTEDLAPGRHRTDQPTVDAIRAEAASVIIAHGFVANWMTPRQVRNEIDHLLGGVDGSVKAEIYRQVMDRL